MPKRPPNLGAVFRHEHFKRASVSRPLIRLYRVPEAALKEVSFSGSGVKPGERLVWWIDPNFLVSCTEAELMQAFHAIVKNLRAVRGSATMPSAEALEIYRLKDRLGLTVAQIVTRFAKRWRDCSDVESRERRVKRYLRSVRAHVARAKERELASLTPRQRAILRMLDAVPPVEPMAAD